MTTLNPNTHVELDFTAHDGGGNPAPITAPVVGVSDHALAYAVQTGQHAVIVSRGPIGIFTVGITGQNASGNPVTPLSLPFENAVGDAATLTATIGVVANNDITTPGIPAGW